MGGISVTTYNISKQVHQDLDFRSVKFIPNPHFRVVFGKTNFLLHRNCQIQTFSINSQPLFYPRIFSGFMVYFLRFLGSMSNSKLNFTLKSNYQRGFSFSLRISVQLNLRSCSEFIFNKLKFYENLIKMPNYKVLTFYQKAKICEMSLTPGFNK